MVADTPVLQIPQSVTCSKFTITIKFLFWIYIFHTGWAYTQADKLNHWEFYKLHKVIEKRITYIFETCLPFKMRHLTKTDWKILF